jgi:hypothetical protein
MIEKIKAFFGRAVAVVKGFFVAAVAVANQVRYNWLAIMFGAVLALFGSGWNPLVGFIGAAIVGVYIIEEIDLPADLAVVIGAAIGAGIAALLRLVIGGL